MLILITKKIAKICNVLSFALIIILWLPYNTYAWELAKEEDGIKVYTKEIVGSDFKAYRAIVLVNATVPNLVKLVKDIPSYPLWIDTCAKGVILKELEGNGMIAYTLNHAPWPVSNRDAIVVNTILHGPEKDSVVIKIEGKPSYIPITDGIVRVKKINGYWKFVPLKSGLCEVTYEVHSEPGGNIPSWLLNQIVVSQPFKTLKNMKEMITHEKYRNIE